MNDVVIFRGPPGSGKTSSAKVLFPNHLLLEADQYFYVGDQYIYDQEKIKDAHAWCLWRFKQAVKEGIPVVVANTFTRVWEIQPYLSLVPDALVMRFSGEFQNVHGVPEEKVQQMRDRMEDVQGEYDLEEYIFGGVTYG